MCIASTQIFDSLIEYYENVSMNIPISDEELALIGKEYEKLKVSCKNHCHKCRCVSKAFYNLKLTKYHDYAIQLSFYFNGEEIKPLVLNDEDRHKIYDTLNKIIHVSKNRLYNGRTVCMNQPYVLAKIFEYHHIPYDIQYIKGFDRRYAGKFEEIMSILESIDLNTPNECLDNV